MDDKELEMIQEELGIVDDVEKELTKETSVQKTSERIALTDTKKREGLNKKNNTLRPPVDKRWYKEEVEDIVEKTHGLTTAICAALDCTNNLWLSYIHKYPDIKALQEQSRQTMVDLAEHKLLENLQSKDPNLAQKAAEFILRRMGANRGWADNPAIVQQINVLDKEIQIKLIFGLDTSNNSETF